MSKQITVGGKLVEVSDEQYESLLDEVRKEVNTYEDLIGEKWFFRTVTYHLVGEVKKIVGRFAFMKNASWIADSGRFNEAIKNGTLSEVEMVGDAFINLDTVVDFFPWKHDLPKTSK
jgi:hypothetical protein